MVILGWPALAHPVALQDSQHRSQLLPLSGEATGMSRLPRRHEFLFAPRDYLHDPAVLAMSLAARGAYSTLLFSLWEQPEPGVTPANRRSLAALARATMEEWVAVEVEVAAAFDTQSREGCWVQKRMVAEHRRQDAFYAQQSRAGKLGRDKQLMGLAQGSPSRPPAQSPGSPGSPGASGEAEEEARTGSKNGGGVSAACLGRLRVRFPSLDLPVIEAKMLAYHTRNPYKSLDLAMINWCKQAEKRGIDQLAANGFDPMAWAREEDAREAPRPD